jgi:hypothetical protein
VSDKSTEHVSEVLVQAGHSYFFVARDVLSLPSGRQMAAGFQRRAAGDCQIMGEVTIGALPETFSNMARNTPAGFGELFVKIEISDQSRPPEEWRNCINSFEGLLIDQQIL